MDMRLRYGLVGFILAVLMIGCAGVSFPYKWYGLTDADYSRGMLLGPKPEDDLKFESCAPNASSKNPCIVFLAPELFKLKANYEKLQTSLEECQRGRK